MSGRWITFDDYEGRYRPDYEGRYVVPGFRFPAIDADRTWDVVRVYGGLFAAHR